MGNTFQTHTATETMCFDCQRIHRNLQRDQEGHVACPDCGNVLETIFGQRDAETKWLTIAIYETTRVYGGPEEGGWHYTEGCLVKGTQRSFRRDDAPVADQYEQLCWKRATEDSAIKYRWGTDTRYTVRVFVEADADSHFPQQRPYYC